jgi:hypothetical protein
MEYILFLIGQYQYFRATLKCVENNKLADCDVQRKLHTYTHIILIIHRRPNYRYITSEACDKATYHMDLESPPINDLTAWENITPTHHS